MLEVHVILHNALADAWRRGIVVRNASADLEPPMRAPRLTGHLE